MKRKTHVAKENKKVKNAKEITAFGIKFKSLLEMKMYAVLKNAGFNPNYECESYVLLDSFKPTVPYFQEEGKSAKKQGGSGRSLKLSNAKTRPMTYTPDITFYYKHLFVIIEVKGFLTDSYTIKKKLFKKKLEEIGGNPIFFEIKTLKQLDQAIAIIKEYAEMDNPDLLNNCFKPNEKKSL